jgi:hypothetical protein
LALPKSLLTCNRRHIGFLSDVRFPLIHTVHLIVWTVFKVVAPQLFGYTRLTGWAQQLTWGTWFTLASTRIGVYGSQSFRALLTGLGLAGGNTTQCAHTFGAVLLSFVVRANSVSETEVLGGLEVLL